MKITHNYSEVAMSLEREGSFASRLTAARDRLFVGREAEQELFRAALSERPGAAPVHYLHGPGGIGKSALLRRFAQDARRAGRLVVEVDGRTVPPTPEDFTAAAKDAVSEAGAVLLVDTFERCQGLEGWLWEQFLPAMPAGAVVVVAGRVPPDARWVSDLGWADLLNVVALRNLTPGDALAFLAARGVPAPRHEVLLRFTGGNPLALALAASVAVSAEHPAVPTVGHTPDWTPSQDVIATLLPQLIGEPSPSATHRKALEICAHAYVTSESLLRALLGEQAPELFAWLRAQPYIESTALGLFPHDVVRETLVADLRWRDPEGFAALHKQLHQHLFEQLRAVPSAQLLPATGALLYLYRTDGHMDDFHDWNQAGLVYDGPCVPSDESRLVALVEEAEGPESAAIARYWLDQQPEAFRVYRSARTDEIVACSAWLRLTDERGCDVDPVVATAWEHARAHEPLRADEFLAVARFTVYPKAYQRPSPATTLAQWRAMGETFRADRLAWHYIVMRDDGFWNEHLIHFDMPPTSTAPVVGGHPYRLFAHDWRAQPVIPWLAARTDAILAGAEGPAEAAVDPAVRQLPELAVLSRPEFDAAVRDALRALRRPDVLTANPLNRSRLVLQNGGDLKEVLQRVVEALPRERGGEKRHRALVTTYLKGAPTQEAAAERLDLPFSTYRRHLTSGVERVAELLWRHELSGTPLPVADAPHA
ncbi:ATP-binding protein [Streptomyces sp. NPDC126514]|uniref:ATP-binding protein n=1 Tax=Streptomyces sp. NPDC126514 TaxID=3155210 RepID=UPI00332C9EA6